MICGIKDKQTGKCINSEKLSTDDLYALLNTDKGAAEFLSGV